MLKYVSIFLISLICSPVWAATIDTDAFTDTDKDLNAHTSTGNGNAWDDDGANGILITSNQFGGDGNNIRGIRLDADVGSYEMDVSAEITNSGDGADSGEYLAVAARCETAASCLVESYMCRLGGDGAGNSDGELVSFAAETATSRATYDLNLDDTVTHNVKIKSRSTGLTCSFNGSDEEEHIATNLYADTDHEYGGLGSIDNESRGDDFLIESVTAVVGIKKGLVMLIGLITPPAFAAETIEYYESDICLNRATETRVPCILIDANGAITNKADRTEIIEEGGKLWVRAHNPRSIDQNLKRTREQAPERLRR